MIMKLDAFYRQVGGDYAEITSRFQNDARIIRFLGMFPKDDSMDALRAAMDKGDAPTAFRAVHTLKGIALNLSLVRLAEACTAMTEALRGSAVMPDNVRALHDAVAREYALVTETLSQLEA